ncbi:MAG: N-6 DNA methylase [Euryarchaeota archaeon]|nr:N-6 DNA methylase [Euryarchaeota archaeon]
MTKTSKYGRRIRSRGRATLAVKTDRNKFCTTADLGNESAVEQFFAVRLLRDLGYKNGQIRPKTSLKQLSVKRGRTDRTEKYRPDYGIVLDAKVRWILEAKDTKESLDKWVWQPAAYAFELNTRDDKENPVQWYAITNALEFRVYEWDAKDPLITLAFADFVDGNAKFAKLKVMLGASVVTKLIKKGPSSKAGPRLTLRRASIEEVNAAFNWCHQHIHKKDNISQAAAFSEFVKVIFLKLLSDRDIRDKHPEAPAGKDIEVPESEVKFSRAWLDARKGDSPNPLDIQFQTLKEALEEEIVKGEKKRIFDRDEKIKLTPETISGVVGRLEGLYLLDIDADLNGRLFETFLSATMRGKDLGQYFTPRSIVKLMVSLADPKAGRGHTDSVLDPCAGTGGFLIDVLARMARQVAANASMSKEEKKELFREIARDRLYGFDIGDDPPLARIARINMYLHGDGGSSIYQADGLDKGFRVAATASAEQKKEVGELKRVVEKRGGFDLILTNPPFAKQYERKHVPERAVLDDYDLAYDERGGARRPLPSVLSKLLFLERYYDFLKPGGRAWAIVDDAILGADDYKETRAFLRRKYLIRAVVSLPGDAFQRSNARVKTSIICLERRRKDDEEQPAVFMHFCTTVGVDDPKRKRTLPIDKLNRAKAKDEIESISKAWQAFLAGEPAAKRWTVQADRIVDRLDVKNCLLEPGRLVSNWTRSGMKVMALGDLVTIRAAGEMPEVDIIDSAETDDDVTFLVVAYDGSARSGETKPASDTGYSKLFRVHTGDIVISHINAVNGAVTVVGADADGLVVSNEFTILRAKAGIDPRLVWALLRSPEARSDLLLLASGIGRHRVKWENAKLLRLPKPNSTLETKVVGKLVEAEKLERAAATARKQAESQLYDELGLANDEAEKILKAFKPPK